MSRPSPHGLPDAGNMLGELASIDSDSRLQRRLRFYARQHLLVIDEVGCLATTRGCVSYSFRPM